MNNNMFSLNNGASSINLGTSLHSNATQKTSGGQDVDTSENEIVLDESSDWEYILINWKRFLKSLVKKHNLDKIIQKNMEDDKKLYSSVVS